MAKTPSWAVTDDFWKRVAPLIPVRTRSRERTYLRQAGGGRKPQEPRLVFEAIVYVLRTGCQWKALPDRFGSGSAVHARFLQWEQAGGVAQIWKAGLAEYDDLHGIAWRWQSIDAAMMNAPLAQESVGANPTDRGKQWKQAPPAGGRTWRPVIDRRDRSQSA